MDFVLPQEIPLPGWFAIGLGVLLLLGGWMLYWISINAMGALLLGACGFLLGHAAANFAGLEGAALVAGIALPTVAGVVVGAFLARLVHALAFFMTGAAVGATVFFSLVMHLRGVEGTEQWFTNDAFFSYGLPVSGVVTGLLCVAMSRFVITLCTALLGAALVASGLDWPLNGVSVAPLMLGGIVIQTLFTRWKPGEDDDNEDGD